MDSAMKYHTAFACIPVAYVLQASDYVDGKYDEVEEEIRLIKEACGSKILKVIIET